MNLRFDHRLKVAERGLKVRMVSTCRLPPSALTLIELLVVIVILTTLVGGVIPILSPNNDVRKIRVAARGLQGYITLAQSRAARTGRPHGIAIRESSAGSGVALEVFGLEVPPAFSGFSSASAVRVIQEISPAAPNDPPTYYLQFILADSPTGVTPLMNFPPDDYLFDPVPPSFLKFNDSVAFGGRKLLLKDNDDLINGVYIATDKSLFESDFDQTNGDTLAFVKTYSDGTNEYRLTAPKSYKIGRQPTNSAEDPYQLPAGIAIDMQGSVAEGAGTPGFPVDGSLFQTGLPAGTVNLTGIMFSPTGAVSSMSINDIGVTNVSRIVLLLGRVENGGIDPNPELARPWILAGNETIEQVQERVNWLNLDSRLLSIATRNGRTVVSETAFVNPVPPASEGIDDNDVTGIADYQIEALHEFAHDLSTAN